MPENRENTYFRELNAITSRIFQLVYFIYLFDLTVDSFWLVAMQLLAVMDD